PDSIKPDGKKRSFITWRNYKPYGPTLTGPKPAPKVTLPPPEAEEPEEEDEAAPEPEKTPETRPAAKGDRGFRIMRNPRSPFAAGLVSGVFSGSDAASSSSSGSSASGGGKVTFGAGFGPVSVGPYGL